MGQVYSMEAATPHRVREARDELQNALIHFANWRFLQAKGCVERALKTLDHLVKALEPDAEPPPAQDGFGGRP